MPPSWHVWKLLNPNQDPILHLRIEPPTILTLRGDSASLDEPAHHPIWRLCRTALWAGYIVVCPIAVTTALLYLLLLYLLKDAELLEAQRHRGDPAVDDVDDVRSAEGADGQVQFSTLARVMAADVERMAVGDAGRVVVGVSTQDEVFVWRLSAGACVRVDVAEVLLRRTTVTTGPSTVTAVAVSARGDMCAVGTATGVVALWTVGVGEGVWPLGSHLVLDESRAVMEILVVGGGVRRGEPVRVLVTYNGGAAVVWTVDRSGRRSWGQWSEPPTRIVPSRSGVRVLGCTAVRVLGDERCLVAHAMADGSLEVLEVGGAVAVGGVLLQAGTSADPVVHVHACRVEVGGRARLVVGVATATGVVSVWDAATGECLTTFVCEEAAAGGVGAIRVVPMGGGDSKKACRVCGERMQDGFAVALSAGEVVWVYRVSAVASGAGGTTMWCGCVRGQGAAVFGRRSRSGSTTSASSTSLSIKRGKLPQTVGDPSSPFPVSGHGVHSRRASEKDLMMRRASEALAVPWPLEEEGTSSASSSSSSSVWQQVVVVLSGQVSCEKGAWDVVGERVVGVRRRSRRWAGQQQQQQQQERGLERWEVWTFDPLTGALGGVVPHSGRRRRRRRRTPMGSM